MGTCASPAVKKAENNTGANREETTAMRRSPYAVLSLSELGAQRLAANGSPEAGIARSLLSRVGSPAEPH
jgi:hypothetical protein